MAYGYDNRFDGRYDSNYNRQKEIQEAIHAGENALRHLYSARDELRSAGNWGLLDMFGGNFLSGMMKHSKMDQARRSMENARNALASFRSELQDIHDPGKTPLGTGDLAGKIMCKIGAPVIIRVIQRLRDA